MDGLQSLGECEIYDRTAPELLIDRAADAEIILTNKTILDRAVIEKLPDMRYIGSYGYGI